jgi:hypothetical protein
VEDVASLKGKSGFSAGNVLVVGRLVVEESSKPKPGFADQSLVLVRDQLEGDRVLSHLLKKPKSLT